MQNFFMCLFVVLFYNSFREMSKYGRNFEEDMLE